MITEIRMIMILILNMIKLMIRHILFFLIISHRLDKLQVELAGHKSQEVVFRHQLLLLVGLAVATESKIYCLLPYITSYITLPHIILCFDR